MAYAVNKITNANVYVDGNNLAGKAKEIDLPTLKTTMAEHKGLGMAGSIELPSGWDKMEGKIMWTSYYADVMKKVANPFKTVSMQVRNSVESYNSSGRSAETPMVTFLTVQFKEFPSGSFKHQEDANFESAINVLYLRQEVGGEVIIEFDPLANIYKVDGVDLLENFRANLGL